MITHNSNIASSRSRQLRRAARRHSLAILRSIPTKFWLLLLLYAALAAAQSLPGFMAVVHPPIPPALKQFGDRKLPAKRAAKPRAPKPTQQQLQHPQKVEQCDPDQPCDAGGIPAAEYIP